MVNDAVPTSYLESVRAQVLFLHTDGEPALFGYRSLFAG
jgi:hypothetical protein